jgi:hypothetical protein
MASPAMVSQPRRCPSTRYARIAVTAGVRKNRLLTWLAAERRSITYSRVKGLIVTCYAGYTAI